MKVKDLIWEGFKFGSVIKKFNSSVIVCKGVLYEQKNFKNVQDKKLFVKDFENE